MPLRRCRQSRLVTLVVPIGDLARRLSARGGRRGQSSGCPPERNVRSSSRIVANPIIIGYSGPVARAAGTLASEGRVAQLVELLFSGVSEDRGAIAEVAR